MNGKMKFYILTSSKLECIDTALNIIPKRDAVVVINSLYYPYVEEAKKYCQSKELEYYVTESDGTPATGKNAVLKLFLESDNDYMVHVDGDDLITPHGYRLYKAMAKHHLPPDMVVLYRQPQIKNMIDYDYCPACRKVQLNKLLGHLAPIKSSSVFGSAWKISYPWDNSAVDIEEIDRQFIIDYLKERFYIKDKTARRWADDRIEFRDMMIKYSEAGEYMTRMVFLSRDIAKEMHYDPIITVGEDTVQFLKLKRLAVEEGKYDILRRREKDYPTYISNYNDTSVTTMIGKKGNDWDWLRPIVDEIEKLGKLSEFIDLPEMNDATYL